MGAIVIITGLSSEIAQTLVTIGVDLSKMYTIGDLQGGIEEAERLLGFKVSRRARARIGARNMLVSILRQGDFLIASIHTALDDSELLRFQQDVVNQIGKHRSRGVIIDVAALDVLDSYGSRRYGNLPICAPSWRRDRDRRHSARGGLCDCAARHRSRRTTALDLEEGLDFLEQLTTGERRGRSTLDVLAT